MPLSFRSARERVLSPSVAAGGAAAIYSRFAVLELTPVWFANVVFLLPAIIGGLLGLHHINSLRARREQRDSRSGRYAMLSLLTWGVAILALTVNAGLADSAEAWALRLLGSRLTVPLAVPFFAYIGVVGYATFSVVENHQEFFGSTSEVVRRKILVSIASRVTIAPYLAVTLALLLQVEETSATAVFIGLFTGLWIKVVLSALDAFGRKLLPERLQRALDERLAAAGRDARRPAGDRADDLDPLLPAAWEKVRHLPNVVGVGANYRQRGGSQTTEPVIVVKVRSKGGVPPEGEVPRTLVLTAPDGRQVTVATDVLEVGEPQLNHTAVRIVAHPGTGVANAADLDNRGTITCVVRDVGSGELLLLSCYHAVKAAHHPWTGVEDPADGQEICDAQEADRLGRLLRGQRTHYVDAAVIEPKPGVELSRRIPEIGEPGPADAVWQGDRNRRKVRFRGYGSGGPRSGYVREKHAIARFTYPDGERWELYGLIALDRCSEPGDSGALLMDEERRALGMIVGADHRYTYATPIAAVLAAMRVTLP